MVKSSDEKRITVRVSPALYDKVVQAASDRNLTINAFIIQALEVVADFHSQDSLPTLQQIVANVRELQRQIKELNSKD